MRDELSSTVAISPQAAANDSHSPGSAQFPVGKLARDIEQAMPIDYRDCIVPALLDEMTPDKAQHYYFIKDLDNHLQGKLRQLGIQAEPESAFPQKRREIQNHHSKRTPYWHWSFAFTGVTKPREVYQADISFSCGTLCFSGALYVLKVVGNTCEILSKQWARRCLESYRSHPKHVAMC